MNDNQFSVAGNIVHDPVLKKVGDNKSVLSFRIASTPRRYDQTLGDWRNLDSLYLTVNCWHKLAERVAECLKGGDPVIVSGRLRMRSYEVDGQRRTVYEVDAQHVSPDLNRIAVRLARSPRHLSEAQPAAVRELAHPGGLEPSVNTGPLVPAVAEPAA